MTTPMALAHEQQQLLLRVLSQNEASGKDPHQVRAMLANGGDVMARDSDGRTALHYAVAYNCPLSVTKALLDWGAMVNAQDDAGLTPLHVCFMRGHVATGGLLLDHGANMFARDKSGRTPKCRALHARIASTLVLHKKNLDAFALQNEQLIALVGQKNRIKFEKLLQDQYDKIQAQLQQQQAEIAAATAIAMKSTTMEQQEQPLQSSRWKFEEAGDVHNHQQQQQEHDHQGLPPKKRIKRIPDTVVTAATPIDGSYCSTEAVVYLEQRMARFEEQLQEQRAETEALKAEMFASRREQPATSCAIMSATTSATTSKMRSKVKMEEEEEQPAVEKEVASISSLTAEQLQRDDKITVMLETIKLELQNVHEELAASRETARRYKKERDGYKMERDAYKTERDHYKKKMEQLHQLTGQT